MMGWMRRIAGWALAGWAGVASLCAQPMDLESPGFPLVFEGVVAEADPALSVAASPGLVISGSLLVRKRPGATLPPQHGGQRFADVADLAEVALDRYRVATYWMRQAASSGAELELVDRPAGEGSDVLELLLPLQADPVVDSDFHATWLYLWLDDPKGELLPGPGYLRATPAVEAGSFELIFWSERLGREARVRGNIRFAGADFPQPSAEDEAATLRHNLRQLGALLNDTETRLRELEKQYATAQTRIAALNQTVDALIAERQALQAELTRLRDQKATAPAEMLDQLAKLEAQVAVEQLARQQEADRNLALAESLARAEADRRSAQHTLADLEKTLDAQQRELERLRARADAPRALPPRDFTAPAAPSPVVAPVETPAPRPTPPPVLAVPEPDDEDSPTRSAPIRRGPRRR